MTAQIPSAPAPPADGEMLAVGHEGSVVAVAMLAGKLHAFDDTCPHAGCSLAEGELDGQTVVCPCHMATFDVTTGEVVDGPAPSGVATWSVAIADGALVLSEPQNPERDGNAPAGRADGDPAAAGPDMDITVLVELEHDAMRRQFEAIDALTDAEELTKAWATLTELLEIHASGEESMLYPKLARAADEGAEEAHHAVREHNEIRDSVRAVQQHAAGSEDWWQALRTAREVNEEHLQEEERDALPLFRESTDRARREQLGREWVAFHEQHQHARGLSGEDVDPDDVVH
ncbi:Ferredoxin subunit of nitrite reductase or a ring-hydroxylating dioxygenase [Modestobacter sp. DSM 44400]|uniref:Rieske 2Fe-2S domain-containing protein n=1 Tax=Modestobacter sp. DSM 44400 TaxID=1550230 RepID=UPI00089461F7|nr:Rieske 2Fe-2S domain-containing protein [Modestobacter sp. DSM 44400]SDY89331.1 Ferredoxin subunit of nitrite reductase or a ring-hydroxylating dioxygenase [Modestobacter sp. DSM 44400]